MNGYENRFSRNWTLKSAIACSLLIVSAQASLANNNERMSFREFKALNPDVARHAARQMFRSDRQRHIETGRLRIQPLINLPNTVSAPATTSLNNGANNHHSGHDLGKNRTTQINDDGHTLRLSSGIDLDLSSSSKNIALGKNLFADGGSIQITIGGESKTFSAGSLVSAAEYVAVKQALSGGQTVTLDKSGRAVGGSVDLESIATDRAALRASELVIPANVTTSGDFSRNSDFKLLGDLNNYGTLQALSSDKSSRSGAIRAVDINNYKGATIRSDISSLTLDASGDLNNFGNIEGAGAITLAAAGSINNRGIVRATNDLNVQASNINNHGLLESTTGNLNLNGSSSQPLLIDNTKGTLQALNGAINLRDSAYNGTFDSYIAGGDLFSKEVNIFAGQATANLNVGQLTGTVNQTGLASHIIAATDVLTMGSACLTGDPTIYNTAGDIAISSTVTSGENLVYVAAGNITVADNISIQAGDVNRGHEINMIAGASFVPDGGGGGGAGAIFIQDIGGVRLNAKASKTGGAIIFGQNDILSARPTDLTGDKNGDGILLVAFSGKGTNSGTVNLAGATVVTGGAGTGKNGDMYVLAESAKGDAITTGVFDTTGGSGTAFGASGTIGLFTVNIISSQKGQDIIYDAFGNRTSSAFLTGELLNKTGNIVITDVAGKTDITAADSIRINAGSLITLNGQAQAVNGSAELVSNGDIVDGPNGSYKSPSVIFLIANNIGTAASPITVDAPDVESFGAKGQSNYVEILGTGPVQIAGNSKGTVSFDAPGRTVRSLDFADLLDAKNIIIHAKDLGVLKNVNGSTAVTVSTETGDIQNSNFQGVNTKLLTLTSVDGSIGTSATAFTLPFGISQFGVKTTNGDINLSNVTGESLTFTQLESTAGDVKVNAINSITLAPTVTAGGALDISTVNGTIAASGKILAGTGISLVNTNGKISIAKNTTIDTNAEVDGEGDITLSVGPQTDVLTPLPISNVQINDGAGTGKVNIFGSGVSAKSPVNTLNTPETADIKINNGTTKSSNISLGGNVIITAQ